jgi:hypothetical protein
MQQSVERKTKAKDHLEVLCANNRTACLEGTWYSGGTPPRSFMYKPIHPHGGATTEQVAEWISEPVRTL